MLPERFSICALAFSYCVICASSLYSFLVYGFLCPSTNFTARESGFFRSGGHHVVPQVLA